ncbi:MAG: TPM domain-containing protein [Pyrinomonadaceae bacterium]|nr:TPM domain-containing protein [Pyrinomonadaceae bacterium]
MMESLIQHKSRLIFFATALALLLLAGVSVRAQSGSAQIPEPTGNAVNDFANIIDSTTEQRLEQILINLKREQKIEFGVVTVKTTGGQDIFDYTLAVGRKWGIGPAEGDKEGLLLLIAVDDRKYFTLVSRHLQGELPDGIVGSIQRQNLVPAFRAGDYGKGVTDTIRAYIDRLAEQRGFSTTNIYPQVDASQPRSQQPIRRTNGAPQSSIGTCCIIIFILIIVVLIFSRGGGSGCLNMLLLGSLFSGRGGGWSSGGWSSGGWGGGGGDSGGGFGGFGGGGDFDGGGAGGSW